MKLDKTFREHHHEKRGITDRIDYVFAHDVRRGTVKRQAGSTFFSIEKAPEGGWTFLGRHFNSLQGAKKEARRYCKQRAGDFT
jgi:hypothetical protein